MPAYIVVEAIITRPENFAPYARAVPPVVASFGGEYLVLGGEQEALEGDWGDARIVIHRWPSREQARAFWHSEEYQAIKPLRAGTGTFRVTLVEGMQQETLE